MIYEGLAGGPRIRTRGLRRFMKSERRYVYIYIYVFLLENAANLRSRLRGRNKRQKWNEYANKRRAAAAAVGRRWDAAMHAASQAGAVTAARRLLRTTHPAKLAVMICDDSERRATPTSPCRLARLVCWPRGAAAGRKRGDPAATWCAAVTTAPRAVGTEHRHRRGRRRM